jgi:TRAP transporter 4TM/12TM fusion protein
MNVLKKSRQWISDRRKAAEEVDTIEIENRKIRKPIERGFLNDKTVDIALMTLTLCMVAIHFVYAQYIFMSIEVYRTMHMCFAMAICLLLTMKSSSKRGIRILHFVFVLMIAFSFVYITLNVDELRLRAWMNTDLDLIVGLILMAAAYYTAGKHFGWVLPILTFIIMIYPMFGQYFTGVLRTTSYSITQTITNLSIGLTGGVYASISVSADYIFLFMVLGGVMGAVGVQSLFVELGKLLVGRFRSGSAQITAVSGAMFGTVSGAAISIAALCAPFCLPNMRKDGYGRVESAAILGASSTGGIILPPIMGAAAFAVAGFANIPYWTICKMAIIPAILYYGSIMVYSHLRAMKNPILRNKPKVKPVVDFDIIKWKMWTFLIPFVLIIIMLSKGYSITKTAFYATFVVIICGYATKKQYRPKFKDIIKGIVEEALQAQRWPVVSRVSAF